MLSKRLRILREESKKTTREMSAMLMLSKSAYSQYENDKRKPDYQTLIALADFFDVSTDYLLGRTVEPKLISHEDGNNPEKLQEASISEFAILKNIKDEGFTLEEIEDILADVLALAKKMKQKKTITEREGLE